MVITQARPKRAVQGSRYHAFRRKRLYERGSEPTYTKIGAHSLRTVKGKGGITKTKVLVCEFANVFDPATKNYRKAKVSTVTENIASRHFPRRNIITKGAVIQTDLGKAKVTSRPGQDGTVNAVLIGK